MKRLRKAAVQGSRLEFRFLAHPPPGPPPIFCSSTISYFCKIICFKYRGEDEVKFRVVPDDKFGRNWRSVKIPNRTPEYPISVGRLYFVAESTLLFTNTSKNPTEVRWVPIDMSTNPPHPTAGSRTLRLHHKYVRDVCYTSINNKELLVYACEDGVFAQNVRSSLQEWSITNTTQGSLVKGNWVKILGASVRVNVCSITTDGRGHVFISDPKNFVVSLFSPDGVELGTVMDLRDIGEARSNLLV